ncbi:MAG: FkbM family methyltransferase [Nanoarchaeota archaeon]|nr:FkbM family methyltransferase [Nanoarchaeota archaeon]
MSDYIKRIYSFLLEIISFLRKNLNHLKRMRWDSKSKKFIVCYNDRTNNDLWILDVLQRKKNGFFIEAGAVDGISSSSTYVLEKYFGWRGILIEPGPMYKFLVKNRKKSICLKYTLSDRNGSEDFYYFPESKWRSCTKKNFNKNISKINEGHRHKINFPIVTMRLKSIKLSSLLDKYKAPKVIDFLSLDLEGAEFDVLKKFPFRKYDIKCICIEGPTCDHILISKGYKKVSNPYNKNPFSESYFIKSI